MLAVTPSGHPDPLEVGAGVRLCEGEPSADFTAGEPGQPLLSLARGPEPFDGERQHEVGIEDPGDRHPHRGDVHHQLGVGRRRQGKPAIVLADGGSEEPQFLHLLDQHFGVTVGVIVFQDPGLDLLLHPALDGLEQLLFVLGVERHGGIR